MADNTNYIGVAMGLDVSDLKSGLAEASKRIGEANADFKAASSSMEDWTKSTEGLNAKVKQLDTVLSAQKSKLAGLKAEYEKVAAEQGENSTAARNLYIRMQNQQAVVNQTQREFDNYSETLKQAEAGTLDLESATLKNGKAISKMGDDAKDTGGKLDGLKSIAGGVVKGIAAIGAAVVGAVGGFLSLAESTRETRTMMGKLEAQFTTAGHSAQTAADTYSELYGVFGDTGKASEAAAFLAEMTSNEQELSEMTNILTGVYAKWGDSIAPEGLAEAINHTAKLGSVQGTLADALEWSGINVDDFNVQLETCATEQERQALIVSTLNGLYSEQADAYKELNKDVIEAREAEEKMNLALAELGAIAEPIMTTLKLLAVDLLASIKPFVELIGTGLKGAFEGTAGAADTLAEGIGGIINALVERFTNMLPTILNIILQLIPSIATTILNALPQLLTVVTDLITQIINLLATLLPDIVAKIVEIIPLLIDNLMSALPQLLQAAITLLMAIVDALPTIITNLINELPKVIDTILTAVLDAFPLLLDGAIQLFMALIDALPTIIQALIKNLPRIINTIVKAVVNAVPLLLDGAIKLFNALIDAIPIIIPLIIGELPKITRGIVGALLKAIPDLIKAGGDLLGGLIKGLLDFKTIKKAIKSLGDSVINGFKSFFGIASPSKLIEDEIGTFVGQAVVPTRQSALSKVKRQLADFSEFVTDNLGGIKAGLSIDTNATGGGTGARVGAGGRNTVINAGMTVNYNGNLSLKQIKRMQDNNFTSIKLRLKAEGAI